MHPQTREEWAGSVLILIERCDVRVRCYYLLLDHCWAHVSGVVILRAVVHLMSPFPDEGVTLATVDALELGVVVADAIEWGKNVEEREAAIAGVEDPETRMKKGRCVGAMVARYLASTFNFS